MSRHSLKTDQSPRERVWLRTASFIGSVGNGATGIALPVALARNLPAWATSTALFGLGLGLFFSFALGGSVADSCSRVQIIVSSDMVRTVMNLCVATPLLLDINFTARVALTTLGCLGNGLMAGLFRPAVSSLWADKVTPAERPIVLATNSLIARLGLATGAGLAGIAVAFVAPSYVLIADAATFVITAALSTKLSEPRLDPRPLSHALGSLEALRIDRHWSEMLRTVRCSPWLRMWFFCNMTTGLLMTASGAALPTLLVQTWPKELQGYFYSVPVMFLVVGGLVTRKIKSLTWPGFFDAWGNIGDPICYVLVALSAIPWLTISVRSSSSLCSALASPKMSVFISEQYPSNERGKAFAAQQGVSSLLSPLGLLLAIPLTYCISPREILCVSGTLSFLIYLVPLTNRGYWKMSVNTKPVDTI